MKPVKITSYNISSRDIISIEVDIRNGIHGIDVMGLFEYAHTATTNPLRAAIINSGFEFPTQRILINLHPLELKKHGTSYDLPMALGILAASGQIPWDHEGLNIMAIGELGITGNVHPVDWVYSAVSVGERKGITTFMIPMVSLFDLFDYKARKKQKKIYGVQSLTEAVNVLKGKGKSV